MPRLQMHEFRFFSLIYYTDMQLDTIDSINQVISSWNIYICSRRTGRKFSLTRQEHIYMLNFFVARSNVLSKISYFHLTVWYSDLYISFTTKRWVFTSKIVSLQQAKNIYICSLLKQMTPLQMKIYGSYAILTKIVYNSRNPFLNTPSKNPFL